MTERSYPWDGTATGDATIAHYDDDEWSDYWSMLMNYDRSLDGVIATNRDGYTDNLIVSNPGTSRIRVGTGIAIVDGKIYANDTVIDFPSVAIGTYSIVLRKDWATQTVRAAIRSMGVTQTDGLLWEIKLADVNMAAEGLGSAIITDQRRFLRNAPVLSHRQGGSATIWETAGTTNYIADNSMMQFGVRSVTIGVGDYDISQTTIFPRTYLFSPIVMATIHHMSAWTETGNNCYDFSIDPTAADFTITFRRQSTADGGVAITYSWMALGTPYH